MSQSDFGTIDAATKSGTQLAADLNAWRTAVHSGHSGTTRPTYAVAGMTWTNTATNPYVVYFFDGTDDIAIGTINTTTNVFTPNGISAGTTGGTATAFTYTPAIPSTGNLENQEYDIEFHTAPSGTNPTLSVSGQTALAVKYRDSAGALQAITSSTTPTGWRSRVVNDGTYWVQRETPPSNTFSYITNDFRLTLTSGTAVTTADVTGATTIYCTPYKGNNISLYSGSAWNSRTTAEFSLALGTLTSGKPYDVFCYDNAGTPTLEFLAWTNDTTRATALAYQDGVLVKSGATTRRYLGTFYTTSTTQTEDSAANRYLWNYYHRVSRKMLRRESTASWVYNTASIRQANNSTSNQMNFVVGVGEDAVKASLVTAAESSTAGNSLYAFIGYDSVSACSTDSVGGLYQIATGGRRYQSTAELRTVPTSGRHYIAWLEQGGGGTDTFYGAAGVTNMAFGLAGEVFA